jgi:hypothetical protein
MKYSITLATGEETERTRRCSGREKTAPLSLDVQRVDIMKSSRTYLRMLPILALLICACSDERNTSTNPNANDEKQIPEMVRPRLSAAATYVQGSDIEVSVRFPASDWDLVRRQKEAFDRNGFWPWHVKINGEYYRLDGGASPLFPPTDSHTERTSHLQLNSGKKLLDSFEWTPGEYRVAYVFKEIIVCHPLASKEERSLDEWASNEVVFRIIASAEQTAGADRAAQP